MKNLNKIGICIGIFVIAIIVIIFIICINSSSKNKTISYNTINAIDESFSIKLPDNILFNSHNDSDFVIDLYSEKDKVFLYVTKITKAHEIDLMKIVSDDKKDYLNNKENLHDDSGISSISIKDYKSYEYSFCYTDDFYKIDFYSNIVWIETDKNLYVLNFEIANENIEKYRDIFLNIKNSFTEL